MFFSQYIMSKLQFNTKYEFWILKKENEYFTNYSYPCCLNGVWRWSILWGGGGMVVASMYPASRKVVKPINCKYTSMLDDMLLLRTLRYDFCKCIVILEHRYVYTKRILISTIIANIEVYILYKCNALLKHWCVYSKRFDLIMNSCTAYSDQKLMINHQ